MPYDIPPPWAGVSEGSRVRIVDGSYGGSTGTFLRIVGRGTLSLVAIDDDTRANRRLHTRYIFPDSPRLADNARRALLRRIFEESRTIEERLQVLTTDAAVVTEYLSQLLEEEMMDV
jgi:hypothetical protein